MTLALKTPSSRSDPSKKKHTSAETAPSQKLPYGLVSITLGDPLRDRLDEVARSSEINRSQIIRDALEKYLAEAPKLEKARKQRREDVRKREFLVALARILASIHGLLEQFDSIEQADSIAHDVADLHQWVQGQLPEGLQRSDLKVPAVEDDLDDFERSSRRLWRAFGAHTWTDTVRRWEKVAERERGTKT